MIDIGNSQP